jgi:hypothetical protein
VMPTSIRFSSIPTGRSDGQEPVSGTYNFAKKNPCVSRSEVLLDGGGSVRQVVATGARFLCILAHFHRSRMLVCNGAFLNKMGAPRLRSSSTSPLLPNSPTLLVKKNSPTLIF